MFLVAILQGLAAIGKGFTIWEQWTKKSQEQSAPYSSHFSKLLYIGSFGRLCGYLSLLS